MDLRCSKTFIISNKRSYDCLCCLKSAVIESLIEERGFLSLPHATRLYQIDIVLLVNNGR